MTLIWLTAKIVSPGGYMNLFYLLSGLFLVMVATLDSLWTTIWVDGSAGPFSARLSSWIWKVWLKCFRRGRPLSLAGPFILCSTIIAWVLMLIFGWTLIFSSQSGTLVTSPEGHAVDFAGKIYFVTYTLFTMGNGDIIPQGGAWQIVTATANATGMIIITLIITYTLSVVSAVVAKRSVGSRVFGLGKTPEEILKNGWDGQSFRALDLPLSQITSELSKLSDQYVSYPILQYYHSSDVSKSPIAGVFILDEALTMLCFGVDEKVRPNPAIMLSARHAVDSLLCTIPSSFIRPASDPPPAPDLDQLRSFNIPLLPKEEFAQELDSKRERRKRLFGLFKYDGRSLKELHS
jgi:hypothetical protein